MIEAPDLTRSPGVLFEAGGVDVGGTTERVREVPRPITAPDVVIGTRRRLPRNRVIPGLESSALWPHRSKPHEAPEAEALQRSRLPLPGARAGQVRPGGFYREVRIPNLCRDLPFG